ncbi:unnamed protein product, partial [Didymodactylos carnosus]
ELPSKSLFNAHFQRESNLLNNENVHPNDNNAASSNLRLKRSPVKKFYEFGSKRAYHDDDENENSLDKRFYDFGMKKRFYDFGVKRSIYVLPSDYSYDNNNDYSKRFYEFGSKRTTE